MKILVFGAGIIGSYLAHILCKNNNVTMLARGTRKQELDKNGLVIRHHLQRKTTKDEPHIIDRLDETEYDIAFVVMPYDNIRIITDQIARINSPVVVCVGNNTEPERTEKEILDLSGNKKSVLFGFQTTAGKRENGILICERAGVGAMDIGMLHSLPDEKIRAKTELAFNNTGYKLNWQPDMQAYLYCHLAAILPIAYVTYICGGDLRKSTSKQRKMMSKASAEGYKMLSALGYPILPKGDDKYYAGGIKGCLMQFLYFVMAKTVMGDLAACEHCRSSVSEMELLDSGFQKIKNENTLPMPTWEKLKSQIPAWEELHKKYGS